MAEDISTLVLQVRSDGIKDGANQLDALTKAADKAEASTKKLGTATAAASLESKTATAAAQAEVEAINNVAKATEKSAVASAQAAIQRKRDVETATGSQIAYMQAQEQAIKMDSKITDSLNNVTRGHGSNAAAMRESMVMMHELSQGSYKRLGGSAMVLANQLDVLPKLMSALGAESALAMVGVAGLALAIVGLGYAMVQGAADAKAFQNSIALTGNAMGVTADSVEETAKRIGASTGEGTSNVRNILLAMTKAGEFTNGVMDSAATAIANYEKLAGVSAEEAVKHFSGMKNGVEAFAIEHGKTNAAVGAEVIEMIHNFEKVGDTLNAQKTFFDAYNKNIEGTGAKLNWLGELLKDSSHAVQDFWHELKGLGTAATVTDQIDKIDKKIAGLKSGLDTFGSMTEGGTAGQIAKLVKERADLVAGMEKAASDARAQSKKELDKKESEEANKKFDADVKRVRDNEEKFADIEKRFREEGNAAHRSQIEIENAISDARAKYLKDHRKRGADDSLQYRNLQIDIAKSAYEEEKRIMDEQIAHSESVANKQHGDQKEEFDFRLGMYQQELKALDDFYAKQIAADKAYMATPGHSDAQKMAGRDKLQKDEIAYNRAKGAILDTEEADSDRVAAKEDARHTKAMKDVETTIGAQQKQLENELKANELREAGIGGVKSAVLEKRKAQEDADNRELSMQILIAQLDKDEAEQSGKQTTNELAESEKKIAAMKKLLVTRGLIIASLDTQIGKEKGVEAANRMTKDIDAALAAGKRFEKGMTDAFGNVGKALGGVAVSFLQMAKDQDTAQRKYNDLVAANVATKQDEINLENEKNQAVLTGYGGAAQAAQGMFEQNSKGYKTMAAVSKVFHVAEAAMQAARMIQLGINAVLTQGSGDPYTAFARMAAMAAIVTELGVALSTGGGGGGGQTAQQVQATQGTGSVFGDATAKSAAIQKSLDLVQGNTSLLIPINSAMLDSLRAIQASMVGLTNLIVRVPGLTGGTNMGIQTGKVAGAGVTGALVTSQIGSMIGGAIAGPLGMWVGAALGTLVGKLWGKTTQNIIDSGIQLQGVVKDLQSGKGFEQYASIDTTKSSFFGLSKSTSNRVETQGLSDELNQQFGLIFSNIENVLKAAAPALGKSSEEVGKAVENFTIPLTKLSLKDLKGDDLTNAINGVISKALDDIAKAAFPGYEKFAQVGEGYSQTLVRVANDVLNVQQVFALLGKTLDLTNIHSADVAESLIAAAGGLDKLQNATKTFTDIFYTDAEKLAPLQLAVQQRLSELGASAVTTNEQFKALVLAQDLTTTAGQAMYLKLLDIAPAFKQVTDAQDKAAQAAKDAAAAAEELAQAIKDKLQKAFDDAMGVVNSAFSALQSSVSKSKADIDTHFDLDKAALSKKQDLEKKAADAGHKAALDNIAAQGKAQLAASKTYYDALKKTNTDDLTAAKDKVNVTQKLLDSIKTSLAVTAQYDLAEAHAKALATVQQAAQSSNAAGFVGIDDAIKELAKPTEQLFGTLTDYQMSQAQANNALQGLQDAGVSQLSDAQKQLDALTALKDSLDTASSAATDAIQTQTQAQQDAENARYEAEQAATDVRQQAEQDLLQARHDAQIKVLDDMLANAQHQIDLLTGIDTDVKSLADAMHQFAVATAAASAANAANIKGGATTGGGSSGSVTAAQSPASFAESLYGTILGRHSDVGGLQFWTDKLASGVSQASVISGFFNSEEYKNMHPSFDVGTNDVPDDMLANIHKGERIIPAADNAELMRRIKSGDTEPSADMVTMNTKLDNLTDVIMRGDVANVQKTNDMYRIFRDWDGNGMPPVRT